MSDARPIAVAIAGAAGRMGREALQALQADPRFRVVGVLVRHAGQALSQANIPQYEEPEQLLLETRPDVWLDLTDARSVVAHTDLCIAQGVSPVVGATGYTPADVERWHQACLRQGIGGIAVPNFAIGALLMMRFAAEAARFFAQAEIIELHHDGKKDAPSGTARRTAEAMAASRAAEAAATTAGPRTDTGIPVAAATATADQPARGWAYCGTPIHSVRLPGLVAHQEVVFGGLGEVLSIRHDSLSRASFMPGVRLACAKVRELRGLVYGLEHLLW